MNAIITYIIETSKHEYYCGKTINIDKRIQEHIKEKRPHWFGFNNRKEFRIILKIDGDYEAKIKKFGIKNFLKCLHSPL